MKSIRSKSITRVILGFALTILTCSSILRAQYAEDALRFSTFNMGVGSRFAGMGNASVGVADDFSALFTNPAGLTSLRSFEFSVGMSNVGYSNDAAFLGNTMNASNRVTNLNNLGIVYPVPTSRGGLSLAFGVARVANYSTTVSFKGFNPGSSIVGSLTPNVNLNGLSADGKKSLLDNNIPFQIYLSDSIRGRLYPNVTDSVQQEGTILEGGGLNSWSLGGAIEIAKGLSLGFGFNLLTGSYSYDRLYTESDAKKVYYFNLNRDDFQRFQYESTINSDISGYNAVIGLMYQKQGKFKLGLTVRTPTYYDISEDFTDRGNSLFYNSDHFDVTVSQSTKYNVKTPPVITLGGSLRLVDMLLLAADAEFTDWTQMEFTNDNPDLIDENRVIRETFRSTTNLRGGAELSLFNLGIQLRAGAVYNQSPYKGDPTSFDQLYYTAGVGVTLEENVFLNASLAFGKWNTFRDNYYLDGVVAPPSRTSESVNTNSFNVTLSYRF
jgi:long-subunit fatty acid transport protein